MEQVKTWVYAHRRIVSGILFGILAVIVAVLLFRGCKTEPQKVTVEPPTPQQIEAIAQATCAVADGLWLTIDREHIMTHGEAADNADGLDIDYPGGPYGPQNTCERWDLQYLGTDESGVYTTDYDDPATGGNVLRGKANWYRQHA